MQVRHVMRHRVVVVGEDERLALAEQVMLWNRIRHLPVLRPADGKLTGVLSQRDILRAYRQNPAQPAALSSQVREVMSSPVQQVTSGTALTTAAATLADRQIGCLPVVDAGALVGIVTSSDVLRALARSTRPATAHAEAPDEAIVASIMYPEPIAVHEDDSLLITARRMAQLRVRHACVVNAVGRVTGIVSDRDLRRLLGDPLLAASVSPPRTRVQALRVRDAMTREPRTIQQDAVVSAALQLFATEPIGALPVVDARGHLRGIVSYMDVLGCFAPSHVSPSSPP